MKFSVAIYPNLCMVNIPIIKKINSFPGITLAKGCKS